MTLRARTATSAELPVGGLWVIAVTGADGIDVPVVTVTLPDDSIATPTVEAETPSYCGNYRAEYVVAGSGRYIARVTTGVSGAVDFAAYVTGTVAGMAMPTIVDVGTYLGDHSWSDAELQDALDAEASAQRRTCDVPAAYPDDLRQGLLRRTWRNLIMRGQAALTIPGAEDGVQTLVPGLDAEIRRFESPFRKLRSL